MDCEKYGTQNVIQIIVSENKTRFETRFDPPLQLEKDKKYEIALVNLETYYAFPKIDATNDTFIYFPDNGTSWVKFRTLRGAMTLLTLMIPFIKK